MIRHQYFSLLLFGCALSLLLSSVGCDRPPAKVTQTDNRPVPEKSFEEIALIVKSALETGAGGVQGGFVSEQANARSHFSVHNDVSSELIKPTSADDNYRAKITVKSHTLYSLRHLPDSDIKKSDTDKKKNSGQDSGSNPLDDSKGSNGNDTSTDGVPSSTTKSSKSVLGRPDDAVNSLSDEESRTYDLVYENGQWALKTPLDPKTELSVINAFNYALKLQPPSP